MKIFLVIVALVIAFYLWRHRSTARAITKTGDREVWAQASDARFSRYPRRARPFARRRGLK